MDCALEEGGAGRPWVAIRRRRSVEVGSSSRRPESPPPDDMAHGAAPPTARLTIWEVWRRTTVQFVSDTNLAGVNNAGRSRHPLRKAVWCCLWVAGLGVTLSDVTMLVRKYLSFPVSTDYSIDSDGTVTFPAVTVGPNGQKPQSQVPQI